ncbi:MAG: UDP-N-acetylglucosamine--N-acetylmuramyl-(pentapeptide) pyrophosphoryl-undecaprenol N-acetylglucosamine transferase [Candidatus Daviesbacteria bacterium]|nr:UDP-N-acetylglucosamine--N-acetylmuramyl-(pentapeptide) pyrophosphoryl-undecaprenol N-acetylglucosamine transferase [Candidatus Daviesbacteria bacterium]
MKVLVTGAHFTPAVATIEELNKLKDVEIVYVGRKTTFEGDSTPSVESQVLPKLGVKFISLITGRLQREFTIFTIPSLLKIPIGFLQAFFILFKEKPDVVLSFGGYIAVPVVIWAWLFSIPIIIHEQAIVAGLANKIAALFAEKIAISFPENHSFNQQKVVLTGNPIRHEIIEAQHVSKAAGVPRVLIAGGNQGSHVINMAVLDCLPELTKIAKVTHQTGDSKFGDFERLNIKQNKNYKVEKFINEGWGKILQECDLVISRAGINTLSELAYLGKPALVIPIAGHPEQNESAKYFENLGLVKILPQSKLSGDSLFRNIREMLKNINKLRIKAGKFKKSIIKDGAKKLALETILLK